LGVVAILLFWGRLATLRSWVFIALMFGFFLAAWRLMGFEHAPAGAGAGIRLSQLPINWWTFVMWFTVALGIRIISFEWITPTLKSPISMLVLVSLLGLLAFSWVGALWLDLEHYGVYYLQAVLSIFAFSRLPSGFWRGEAREKWVAEWFSVAKKGLLFFTVGGVLIGVLEYSIHRHSGINSFRDRILCCLLLFSVLAILLAKMQQSRRFSAGISAVTAGVLLFGFLGWLPPWLKYRVGGQSYNATLASGEVAGLQRLHEIADPGERFATNRHSLGGETNVEAQNSYAYGTLSGHPVLLEGYYDGAEENIPGFATLLHDNELLFTTTNPDVMRDVAQSYRVRWIVARPGTDIGLPRPLPPWLVQQNGTGDLRIYQVN
jgi:hypothetical protein